MRGPDLAASLTAGLRPSTCAPGDRRHRRQRGRADLRCTSEEGGRERGVGVGKKKTYTSLPPQDRVLSRNVHMYERWERRSHRMFNLYVYGGRGIGKVFGIDDLLWESS